jgi:hypothetical protein
MSEDNARLEEKQDVWTDIEIETQTITGEKISYPKKIAIGKELKFRHILREKLSPFLSTILKGKEIDEEKAFSFLFFDFPAIAVELAAVITEQTKEWVLENLEGRAVEEIVRPFFQELFRLPQIPLEMKALGISVPGAEKKGREDREREEKSTSASPK